MHVRQKVLSCVAESIYKCGISKLIMVLYSTIPNGSDKAGSVTRPSGLAASQWCVGWMTRPLGCVEMPGKHSHLADG